MGVKFPMLEDVPMKYKIGSNEKEVIRKNIRLEKNLNDKLIKTIAEFNKSEKVIKLNHETLINLALKDYLANVDFVELKKEALKL